MDWTAAAAHFRDRLRQSLQVARRALDLATHPRAEVDPSAILALKALIPPLERQLGRLERGEFRIAVVGLEKAGKSTLVNAWLEHDLLPSDSARCTFTTTRVHAVAQEAEQRLEIDPFTPEEFQKLQDDLARIAQANTEEGRRAQADLDAIAAMRGALNVVIDEGERVLPFQNLEEIAEPLRRAVADPAQAYAVKEVRLFTNRLAAPPGVVFQDVPGLNSGLAKHVEESRAMLADCDAVILVQRSSTPSIEASEQRLIEFVHQGDDRVGVAGKLFVFLGRIDQEGSAESLRDNLELATRDWEARGRLTPDRIVVGSAAAFLVLKNLAKDNLLKNAGNRDKLLANLRHVTRCGEGYEDLLQATGIPRLKERVQRYLEHERVEALRLRCEEAIDDILRISTDIHSDVRHRFPEDPELARQLFEDERRIRFSNWWPGYWDRVRAELNRHYEREVIRRTPESPSARPLALEELRTRYVAAVEEGLNHLPALQPERRDTIFDSGTVFDSTRANLDWRRELYRQIADLLDDVARALALELEREATSLVDVMSDLLFRAPRVRAEMKKVPESIRLTMEHGLRALFLRFARPIAEALIRGPLGSETRQGTVVRLGPDIDLIDHYYEGGDPTYASLKRYLTYGPRPPADAREEERGSTRRSSVNVNGATDHPAGGPADSATSTGRRAAASLSRLVGRRRNKTVTSANAVPPSSAAADLAPPIPATRREDIIREVHADLEALRQYLLHAVFHAAGFAAFCEQELGRLRDRFLELESTWRGVAENEWLQGNPRLLAVVPPELRDSSGDTEICDRLKRLGAALREAWMADTEEDESS
ncbi:dynamin family protein [Isosphaera pallida]|jgi:GTPase Era involved in 16S rRNA processing|nr:dynamin family protein [Isosphaera pallida]